MKYCGTLIAVSDMDKARNFYQTVMEQTIMVDLGVHVSFESGLSLQLNYQELVGEPLEMRPKPDNFQLYFEVEDLDRWEERLRSVQGIKFLHSSKSYPWGQRVLRFYDLDQYIVEVSESMTSVAKRFLAQGLTVEETAQRTMFPVEFVQGLV